MRKIKFGTTKIDLMPNKRGEKNESWMVFKSKMKVSFVGNTIRCELIKFLCQLYLIDGIM